MNEATLGLKNPYPAINFERAYEYLKQLKARSTNKDAFGRKELLDALGFNEKNVIGHNVIGSLSHYRLIWRDDIKIRKGGSATYRITSTASRLLQAETSPETWKTLAVEAATAPELFRFVSSKYPEEALPTSLKTELITKYNRVGDKNVNAIISRYEQSLSFVELKYKELQKHKEGGEMIDLEKDGHGKDKTISVNLGDGITMTLPEPVLADILRRHLASKS